MSQTENAVTSSSGKTTLQKGNPVPARERQKRLLQEGVPLINVHAVIQLRLKEKLSELADEEGSLRQQML